MNNYRKPYGWKKENEAFALMLNKRLQERRVKPADFAKALGVDKGTVYRWLRAEVLPINRDMVFRIADILLLDTVLRDQFTLAYLNKPLEELIATETTQIVLVEPPSLQVFAPSLGTIHAHELPADKNQAGKGIRLLPNELITFTMFIQNREPEVVNIIKIVAAVRGPGAHEKGWDAEVGDFGTIENIKLTAGEIYKYKQENIFYKPGDYNIIPLFLKPDGEWQEIRPRRKLYFFI